MQTIADIDKCPAGKVIVLDKFKVRHHFWFIPRIFVLMLVPIDSDCTTMAACSDKAIFYRA